MKRHLVLLVAMLLMQAAAVSVFAQDKPKAGDLISGFVDDDYGPLMMTTVNERDAADRIVAHCITANDGSFSFKLVNPKDRLVITYVGYEKVDIPIDTTYYEIKMVCKDDPQPDGR